ncbi:MAG: CDP-alcohol phosphatidyltransferase family protein [Candidatus Omnitrophota bacterium]
MALSFANKVTVGRILIVPFFIGTTLSFSPDREYLRYVALGAFLLAVISDVIDGYIARTHHQKTLAGAILDPVADKLLLISAFLCLFKMRSFFGAVQFPLWVVVTIISRDIILLLGSMIIYIVQGKLNIVPTKWGKATTFLQVLCILGILLQWEFSISIWSVAVILTVISGIGYIREGVKVLNDSSQHRA